MKLLVMVQVNMVMHFLLKEEGQRKFEDKECKGYTSYNDGNNLLIQCLNNENTILGKEEGKIFYAYRKEMKRPAFVFEKSKNKESTQRFFTILYPYETAKAPKVSLKGNS